MRSPPVRRRSCLAVPGSAPAKLAKAGGVGADEVVLDLEDAVVPAAKEEARAAVVAALESWDSPSAVAVRVNAPRSPWCHADIAALGVVGDRPVSIVVPKVESGGDLAFVERLLDGVEAASGRTLPLRVQALIETAAGLERVREIATASGRLDALVVGYADLGASLGGSRGLDAWLPVQHAVVVAARAAGVQAIDGPHLGVAVDELFTAALARAAELGLDGKWVIHPSQLSATTDRFTPSAADVARARAVIAALERSARDGEGAVALDSEMLDEAVRVGALRVLAQAGVES